MIKNKVMDKWKNLLNKIKIIEREARILKEKLFTLRTKISKKFGVAMDDVY